MYLEGGRTGHCPQLVIDGAESSNLREYWSAKEIYRERRPGFRNWARRARLDVSRRKFCPKAWGRGVGKENPKEVSLSKEE